ncbi:MAG: AAA family ATPase, partial [Treponema sp.]|nr:AAA family ATPase [Treponema sp.]
MRINRLVFKNINSLAGVWEIDFNDPAFNDGIFILSGPTGSGKTSILDAICLGLYGKTSRQDSFSAVKNEVMTKGTASCFSQVEFETQGRQYRATWEHRKKGGRKKEGNEFQPQAIRKISEITKDNERTIAESVRDADREIAAILNMDFKQFTSAVLLPQGKFDEFLTADKRIRSEILEKITGSRIYSQIGSAVQQRKAEEEKALESIRERAETIRVFNTEEEKTVREELAEQRRRAGAKEKEALVLDGELAQRRRHEKLLDETAELEQELSALEKEEQSLAAGFAGLERAKKAAVLAAQVSAWEQCEKEQSLAAAETERIEQELAALARNEAENGPRLLAAEAAREEARNQRQNAEPVIKKIRDLSVEFRLKQNEHIQKEAEKSKAERELRECTETLKQETLNLSALSAELAELEAEAVKTESAWGELVKTAEDLQNRINGGAVFSRAPSFEEARKSLKNGEACPLCGSEDHPFCTGAFEEQEKQYRELLAQKIETEKALRRLEAERETLRDRKNTAEKKRAVGEERQTAAGAALSRLGEDHNELAAETETLRKKITEITAALTGHYEQFNQYELCEQNGQYGEPSGMDRAAFSPGDTAALDRREQRLQAAFDRAEADYTELHRRAETLAAARAVHEKNRAEKKDRETTLAKEAAQKHAALEAGFGSQGFSGLEEWRRFFWETGKIVQVEQKKTELAVRIANAKDQVRTKKAELAELPAFPPEESAQIEDRLHSIRDELRRIHEDIGESQNKLAENETRKTQRSALEQEGALRAEQRRLWKRMDDWIGGKDGFRFKQFAQAITFEQLLHNSRPYLLEMSSGRYELSARAAGDALIPTVIDRHQGSIERVISNLSGGERFLLSLALALGLSRLNSKNLRIDSLFLDEGFGTLDRESLELAINILSRLRQNQGKLTGIISHVEELQERIAAVIRAGKSGGG